jgi:hypothetical protein
MGQRSFVVRDGYAFVRNSRGAIERGNYFFANSHFSAHSLRLPPDTFTVTVVRSPIERVISLYRYLWWIKNEEGSHFEEVYWHTAYRQTEWLGSSFHDFLDRIPRHHLTPQIYMFSDSYDVEEAIGRAMSCSAILFKEQFRQGLESIGRTLGLPLREKHERRFGSSLQIDLSSGERDRLTELVKNEITFVDRLKSLWHSIQAG